MFPFFITMVVAWSWTLPQDWVDHMCNTQELMRDRTGGKAGILWTTMFKPMFDMSDVPGRDISCLLPTKRVQGRHELRGVRVKYLTNPDVLIADAWSGLSWLISVAATCDPSPRDKDWFLELLVVCSILLAKVASAKKLPIPRVVHILWTSDGTLALDAPSPSDDLGSPDYIHALGSTTPVSGNISFNLLRDHRQTTILSIIRERKGEAAVDRMVQNSQHDNLGKCAETLPYISILFLEAESTNAKSVTGAAFKPSVLVEKQAAINQLLTAEPYSRMEALNFLHVAGFETACTNCLAMMEAADLAYEQYKRNQDTYERYLSSRWDKRKNIMWARTVTQKPALLGEVGRLQQ
ncbi:hypothetical protein M407DRAFT_236495 [Tulasnella calospora MUT 4182]|uniref:Uncharacterized protein n=1 Tax=Tulasnella calospora MUT 4182 TaxID=1051891 RepID=A0A0C3Q7Y1_9AGAM|nr:hypothetical protein M407DRAFT_236495 [Tulasnella calospora MUT 4182]